MSLPAIDEWLPPPIHPPARRPLRPAFAPRAPQRRALAPHDLELLLDCATDGMVVIDVAARVLHANRPARELLQQVQGSGGGASGGLTFGDRSTQLAFERALRGDGDDDAAPRQFLVRDGAGTTLAHAVVEPLQRCRSDAADASTHLVSLHRRRGPADVCADALRALYGLTAAEARVAAGVIAVASVDALALQVGLSRNTVKTHLKSVFRKCEVASFAQLAALVATSPRRR